jgi:6-phosphogluconolactonase
MFDCILLGMGSDGHTASLFPGTPALESGALVEAVVVKYNPIPNRLTFTLRVLNSARACVFLVTGEGKSRTVFQVLKEEDYQLPATRVNPDEGRLVWILDEAAASELYE